MLDETRSFDDLVFIIPIKMLIDKFGCQMYFVDQLEDDCKIISRVILLPLAESTLRVSTASPPLTRVNTALAGSALKTVYGAWQVASRCRAHSTKSLSHQLKLGVAVTPEDVAWLLQQCYVKNREDKTR